MVLLHESIFCGGMSSILGERYVITDENKKNIYTDAIHFYGYSMSEVLPYDEIEMWHGHPDLYMKKIEKFLKTFVDSDFGYFIQVDSKYPDVIKEKKHFPYCPENKISLKDNFITYMKEMKPDKYT